MGQALSAPVELVRVRRHGSEVFRLAAAEMQGWRSQHEDAASEWLGGSSASVWLAGGHGGGAGDAGRAARFGAAELAEEFRGDLGDGLPSEARVAEGFEAVDARLRARVSEGTEGAGGFSKDGACAGASVVGVLATCRADVGGERRYALRLAGCGDARGFVVCGPGGAEPEARPGAARPSACGWPVLAESACHRPSDPRERARIEAAGGSVSEGEPARVDGRLTLSRALGDFELKGAEAYYYYYTITVILLYNL